MGVTLQSWLAALQALLPPGRAFTHEPDSVLTGVLTTIAAMLLAIQSALQDLLMQSDPRDATTMLPDWERLLGLPDRCAPSNQALVTRQRTAFQRLTEQGGQSRAYFVGLATLLGEPNITIDEFEPMTCNSQCTAALCSPADRFVWRVNIPRPALNPFLLTCNSPCDAALQAYTQSIIECAFTERKPAHTTAIFAYGP